MYKFDKFYQTDKFDKSDKSDKFNKSNLTIKYLINFLNNHENLQIERHKYLIDSFPVLKMKSNLTYDNLLTAILIAYNNIKYQIDYTDYKIMIDDNILRITKSQIQKTIFESVFDLTKKKKYINFIQNLTKLTIPTNESILVLTHFFQINLIIYNTKSQTIKTYYYDNLLDTELPFIICKETSETDSPTSFYELVFVQDKFIFDFNHPLVTELIVDTFIVGLEQNKKLEYVKIIQANISQTNVSQTNFDLSTDFVLSNKFIQSESFIQSNDSEQSILKMMQLRKQKNIVKLKMIPKWIYKLIDEMKTTNFHKLTI